MNIIDDKFTQTSTSESENSDANANGSGLYVDEGKEQHTPSPLNRTLPKDLFNKVKYPTWVDLLAIIGVYIVASLLSGLLMLALNNFTQIEKEVVNSICYALQFLLVIGFVVLQRKSRGETFKLIKFKFEATTFPLLLWGVVLVLAASFVIEPLLMLFPSGMLENAFDGIGRGGWAILQLVVLAPLLEEVLFRGLIQGALNRKYNALVSILLASLIFGIVHIIPQQIVNAFVIGIILGYIYYRTQSLATVVIIHAINNAIAYVMLEIFGNESVNISMRDMINNDTVYYVVYAVCAVVFVAGIVGIVKTLNKEPEGEEL